MNPYTILSSGVGSGEAAALSVRLSAWHDAMVAHEAVSTFGARAQELTFLRSRGQDTRASVSGARANAGRMPSVASAIAATES